MTSKNCGFCIQIFNFRRIFCLLKHFFLKEIVVDTEAVVYHNIMSLDTWNIFNIENKCGSFKSSKLDELCKAI